MTVIFPLKEAGDKLFAQELQGLRNDILTRGEFVVAGGSANAFTITIDDNDGGAGLDEEPITWPLANGHVVMFEANHSIDGAATLNVNGNGAIAIKVRGADALISGDIVSGQFVICFYDAGSNVFQMVSPVATRVETIIKTQKSGLLVAGENITVSGNPKACFIGAGDDVDNSYDALSKTDITTAFDVYGANWFGGYFRCPVDRIVSIKLNLDEVGTAPGNFNCSIYAMSGTSPTGSPLATASILGTAAPNSDAEVEFIFSQPVEFTKGDMIGIVTNLPSGVNSSNCVQINYDASVSNLESEFGTFSSTDSGSSWTPSATTMLYCKINGYDDGSSFKDSKQFAAQTTDNSNFLIYGNNWIGQTLPVDDIDYITEVTFELDDIGFPPGGVELKVDVYNTSGGLPIGSSIATRFRQSAVPSSDAEFTFAFQSAIPVTEGSDIAVVLSYLGGVSASHCYEARYKSSGTPYADGQLLTTTDAGANWTASSTGAMYFKIKGFEKIDKGKVYKSDKDKHQRSRFDGFIAETVTAGNSSEIQLVTLVEGFTDLTAGKQYSIGTDGEIEGGVGLGFIGRGLSEESIEIDKSKGQVIGELSVATVNTASSASLTIGYAPPGTREIEITIQSTVPNRTLILRADSSSGDDYVDIDLQSGTLGRLNFNSLTRLITFFESGGSTTVTLPTCFFRFYK